MLDVSVCAQCLEVSPQNKIIKENEMVYEGTSVQFAQQLPESESHSVEYHSLQPHGLYSSWNSPGQNTGVGSCSLLHGIFPTQGSNPDLPHCRWILHQLSHQGSPRILEWVAYPFSGVLPDTGIEPGSPALQVDSLLAELPGNFRATREFQLYSSWNILWHCPSLGLE